MSRDVDPEGLNLPVRKVTVYFGLISVQTENKRGAFKTNHNRIKGDSINDYKKGFILRMKGAVSFCMSKSKGFITK